MVRARSALLAAAQAQGGARLQRPNGDDFRGNRKRPEDCRERLGIERKVLRHLCGREERRRGGTVQLLRVWLERFGRLIDRKAPPALGRVIEGKFDQSRIFGVFAAVPSAGRIAAVGRKHAKDELVVDLEHSR